MVVEQVEEPSVKGEPLLLQLRQGLLLVTDAKVAGDHGTADRTLV